MKSRFFLILVLVYFLSGCLSKELPTIVIDPFSIISGYYLVDSENAFIISGDGLLSTYKVTNNCLIKNFEKSAINFAIDNKYLTHEEPYSKFFISLYSHKVAWHYTTDKIDFMSIDELPVNGSLVLASIHIPIIKQTHQPHFC